LVLFLITLLLISLTLELLSRIFYGLFRGIIPLPLQAVILRSEWKSGSPVINSKILRFFGTSSLRMTGGENSSGGQKRKFSPQ